MESLIVNCAGRTRSIIGAQSLINAGLPNPVAALRNGTIGWTLAGLELEHGQARRAPGVRAATAARATADAWRVADLAGHVPGAAWAPRADLASPALAGRLGRPARLVLTSDNGYLAAWAAADLARGATVPAEVSVLAGGTRGWERSGRSVESGRGDLMAAARDVYRRPYEGTGVDPAAMQAYLDWEYGLLAQLDRDGTHGFSVLVP
jgi:hypothetical protein